MLTREAGKSTTVDVRESSRLILCQGERIETRTGLGMPVRRRRHSVFTLMRLRTVYRVADVESCPFPGPSARPCCEVSRSCLLLGRNGEGSSSERDLSLRQKIFNLPRPLGGSCGGAYSLSSAPGPCSTGEYFVSARIPMYSSYMVSNTTST